MNYKISFNFPESDSFVANQLASDLERDLSDEVPGAKFSRGRSNRLNQDFGTTLIILLAAPAVVELARGFQAWMAKRNDVSAEVTVENPDGSKQITKFTGRLSDRELKALKELQDPKG